jgi:hypothetical protein
VEVAEEVEVEVVAAAMVTDVLATSVIVGTATSMAVSVEWMVERIGKKQPKKMALMEKEVMKYMPGNWERNAGEKS